MVCLFSLNTMSENIAKSYGPKVLVHMQEYGWATTKKIYLSPFVYYFTSKTTQIVTIQFCILQNTKFTQFLVT